MQKSNEEKRSQAYEKQDKLAISLEDWTTKLIRAAKKVESKRREIKAVRSQIVALEYTIAADRARKREERKAGREQATSFDPPYEDVLDARD